MKYFTSRKYAIGTGVCLLVILGIVYYFFFSSLSAKEETCYLYIDEDDNYHQVGEGWGDDRFTISFKDEGILNSRVGRNSFKATYQTHVKGAHLTSGDDLAYTGTISLSNASMTKVYESDPVAIYFSKYIGTIAYFDVNSFYLRLVTSNGVTFSFRESTLK